MKIKIDEDGLEPFYQIKSLNNPFGLICDVPKTTVQRWKAVMKEFQVVQKEMKKEMEKGEL